MLGALGGIVVVLGGLMAWLMKIAFSIGSSARVIEHMREDLVDMKKHADQVPLIKRELDAIADAMSEHRKKTDSDIRELRRSVYGRSSPHWTNGEGEE
jgi:hypothetical protein